MSIIREQLDRAEGLFRKIITLENPLRKDWPVDKKPQQGGHMWLFANDHSKYIAQINDPKAIEEGLIKAVIPLFGRERIAKLYGNSAVPGRKDEKELVESLARDNFVYLFFHEMIHDTDIPRGRKDAKRIDLALYRGIKEAAPGNRADILRKVGNIRNLIHDFGDDCTFYAMKEMDITLPKSIETVYGREAVKLLQENIRNLPDAVVPIWDIVEFHHSRSQPSPTYPLSRILYGKLFINDEEVRENVNKLFEKKAQQAASGRFDPENRAKDALEGVVKEIDAKAMKAYNLNRDDYLKAVDSLFDGEGNYLAARDTALSTMMTMLEKDQLRYDLFRGFVQSFADLISTQQEEGRFSMGGTGGNASEALANILEALAEEGDESEAQSLLTEVANAAQQELSGGSTPSPGGNGAGEPSGKQVKLDLAVQAADEFYRQNAVPIKLRSPHTRVISKNLGNRKILVYKTTHLLTPSDLATFNIKHILALQQASGIPMLRHDKATNLTYYYEYKVNEIPVRAINYEKSGIELPEYWFMFNDVSGSMNEGGKSSSSGYLGSENKFDQLNRIDYGWMKAIYPVAKEMGIPVNVGAVQFSNSTVYSGVFDLESVYKDHSSFFKKVQLIPQWGGTAIKTSVFDKCEKDVKHGKAVYTIVSDGDITGDVSGNMRKIEEIANKPDRSILFIGVRSGGSYYSHIQNLASKHPNVQGRIVGSVKDVEKVLGEVLIKYTGDS